MLITRSGICDDCDYNYLGVLMVITMTIKVMMKSYLRITMIDFVDIQDHQQQYHPSAQSLMFTAFY